MSANTEKLFYKYLSSHYNFIEIRAITDAIFDTIFSKTDEELKDEETAFRLLILSNSIIKLSKKLNKKIENYHSAITRDNTKGDQTRCSRITCT